MTMSSSPRSPLPALALIALIVGILALVFAWVGGWLSPTRISGAKMVDSLEYNAGKHPGWRRAHSKGVCVAGHFEGNGAGAALSRASVFQAGSVPVVGRFSTGGSDPFASDGRVTFHSMALRFTLPGGEEWRTAMDHTPIFPVATPEAFVALQIATAPDPATHKPDMAKVKAYIAGHPETQAFQDYMKTAPLPSSFANGTYFSINAFRFIDAQGNAHAVRWQFEPETPFTELDKATLDKQPPDFLLEDAVARLKQAPLKWHLVLIVAAPGDPTNNATIAWPMGRQRIDAGTLVLDRAASEQAGGCRDFNFDPLILPKGIAASDDPLLAARSAAYASSFRRRAGEGPHPDALTIAARKGEAK
jgi:catalase